MRGRGRDPPRYHVEHRHPDLAALVVAFADDLCGGRLALGRARGRLARRGEPGRVVLVDQATEAVVASLLLEPRANGSTPSAERGR